MEKIKYYKKNMIMKIFIIITTIIVLVSYSCKKNILLDNEIELLKNNYIIIDYVEGKFPVSHSIKIIGLEIEITNYEKIIQLNNLFDPVIYLEFKDKKYLARGKDSLSTSFPKDCDYCFLIDDNMKIKNFENNKILFLGKIPWDGICE